MSGKFKISLIVVAGIALSLVACDDIGDRPPSTPPAATNSPNPPVTPAPSKPAIERREETPQPQTTPQVNRSVPPVDSRRSVLQAERSNFKSIPLEKIASSRSLKGTDPKAIALDAFSDIQSEGGARVVAVEYPQPDKAVVNITQTGVADDSVGGIKYRVEFVPKSPSSQTAKEWEMVWAGSQVKCHVGRGHQDWSTENCR